MTDQEKIEYLAEKVLGWKVDFIGENIIVVDGNTSMWNPLASISDAWMVVNVMDERGRYPEVSRQVAVALGEDYWLCCFKNPVVEASGDTAPLAICNAAIKATVEIK